MHMSLVATSSNDIRSRADWARPLLGLTAVYLLFHWTASALGSDRGQAGLAVSAIVVAAATRVDGRVRGHPFRGLLVPRPLAASTRVVQFSAG
jgi:hypothetical protein